MGCRRPSSRRASGTRVVPAAVALLTLVGWGWPHTELKESDPVGDAVLDASPSAVTLIYTTEVQLALSTVTVRRAGVDGTEAAAGELTYLAEDRHDVLVLPLTGSLSSGSYVVRWTTAGPDGHALSGELAFQVQLPAPEPAEEEPAAEVADEDAAAAGDIAGSGGAQAEAGSGSGFDLAPTATRFLFYGGIVVLLGAVAFRLLVLGQGARTGVSQAVNDAAARRVRNIAVFGLVALLASLPIRLWHQAAAFFPGDVAGNLFTVATGTAWGAGWWLQLGLVVLLAGGIGLARADAARSVGWAVTTLGVLLLPVVPVLSGHGWADSPRVLSAAATYLHVVAAGGWVGGLLCLLFAGLPALRQHAGGGAADTPGLAGMVGGFSRVARFAVALLLVSGAVKVWIHIGAVSDLWTTAWGRSLLVKDLVVAGVLALGLYNWRVVRPALAARPRTGLLMKPAVIELILGAAAVAVTSFLVAQPLT